MTNREFYLARRKAEHPAFLNVLKALPQECMVYKPHERSPSAQQLAWTITSELAASVELCDTGGINWSKKEPPGLDAMIAAFEKSYADLEARVRNMDDAAWARKGQLKFDGKLMLEPETGDFLWYLLFDGIHHRGQLAAYIRPMGGKVPAIYGPSADSRGSS
jgi:uncharacterized damage-inducible protein DinB